MPVHSSRNLEILARGNNPLGGHVRFLETQDLETGALRLRVTVTDGWAHLGHEEVCQLLDALGEWADAQGDA